MRILLRNGYPELNIEYRELGTGLKRVRAKKEKRRLAQSSFFKTLSAESSHLGPQIPDVTDVIRNHLIVRRPATLTMTDDENKNN